MDKLKISSLYLLIFLLVGVICVLGIHFFGESLRVNNALHLALFALNIIGFVAVLCVYNFTKYKGLGFVFLALIIFKFFAMAFLFYRYKSDFSEHLIVYFLLYWIYMMTDMFLVLKLIKKQD